MSTEEAIVNFWTAVKKINQSIKTPNDFYEKSKRYDELFNRIDSLPENIRDAVLASVITDI